MTTTKRTARDCTKTDCNGQCHLEVNGRDVCEFNRECTNAMSTWTSFYGHFYPVCADHLNEAVSI